jgi:hypothetical protein
MDKAAIEKILGELDHDARSCAFKTSTLVTEATSSLTALIIKWLESKREPYKYGRNQLITELVEELK